MLFSGFIFHVEGTLIDCIPQNQESLQETVAGLGVPLPVEVLQLYSVMDGDDAPHVPISNVAKFSKSRLTCHANIMMLLLSLMEARFW